MYRFYCTRRKDGPGLQPTLTGSCLSPGGTGIAAKWWKSPEHEGLYSSSIDTAARMVWYKKISQVALRSYL